MLAGRSVRWFTTISAPWSAGGCPPFLHGIHGSGFVLSLQRMTSARCLLGKACACGGVYTTACRWPTCTPLARLHGPACQANTRSHIQAALPPVLLQGKLPDFLFFTLEGLHTACAYMGVGCCRSPCSTGCGKPPVTGSVVVPRPPVESPRHPSIQRSAPRFHRVRPPNSR